MATTIVVGAQWGDEGKGKATDILGGRVDYIIKPSGGNNAGHIVVVGGEKYELRLLPADVLSENATPIIGNGCVVNLETLFDEAGGLGARGTKISRLRVPGNTHMAVPYHQTLDHVTEHLLDKRAIDTTSRDIGPTYADKVGRTGLRVQDILDGSILRQKTKSSLAQKNQTLAELYNRRAIDPDKVFDYFMGFTDRLRPMIIDSEFELSQALDVGKHVLIEGGQATMLNVDHGTYPFVTSSNSTAGGACVGTGIGPTKITSVLGTMKTYTTRVSAGPFPTELFDKWGEYLRTTGGEVGVNTGRKRHCGWYDSVLAHYAMRVNGFTDLFITKLDVLIGIGKIPICVVYDVDGVRHDEMPLIRSEFHHTILIYKTMPAWGEDITGRRTFDELPDKARDYLNRLEELSGTRISYIGVGPDRDQTIVVHDVLDN